MRKSFFIPGTLMLLIFVVFSNSFGDDQWVPIGPYGGSVHALVIKPQAPDTLYAGTDNGVFKSTNGGTNWTAINSGLTDTGVSALAIDPQTPDTLYAGTSNGGVFKSTNGGMNWTAINTGLTNTHVNALAIDPQTPDILYAGTNGDGVFKSTNGGTRVQPVD
jgi:ligand-binding sensor domain-containing protein